MYSKHKISEYKKANNKELIDNINKTSAEFIKDFQNTWKFQKGRQKTDLKNH